MTHCPDLKQDNTSNTSSRRVNINKLSTTRVHHCKFPTSTSMQNRHIRKVQQIHAAHTAGHQDKYKHAASRSCDLPSHHAPVRVISVVITVSFLAATSGVSSESSDNRRQRKLNYTHVSALRVNN